MESLFEQLGGTYTRQGDYCLPDVCLPPEEERPIGVYGQRRRAYLKEHHRVLYYNLLTAGTLDGHLADIEEQAQELFLRLVEQYADTEGVTATPTWITSLKSPRHRRWRQGLLCRGAATSKAGGHRLMLGRTDDFLSEKVKEHGIARFGKRKEPVIGLITGS